MLDRDTAISLITFNSNLISMKIAFLFILLSFSFLSISNAQSDLDFFIDQKKDSTFCTQLKYATNTWGELNYLSYTSLDGSPIVFKSKKTISLILTLHIDGKTIDRIPLRPNSKREIRYAERTVDGPLKVYLIHQDNSNTSDATVMYIFYIRFPDNSYYKINDKGNMNSIIIPYLKKCEKFVSEYKGDYSNKEEAFIEMIQLYNAHCPL